jgi:GH35 family endo-1,4-beta-xylanase
VLVSEQENAKGFFFFGAFPDNRSWLRNIPNADPTPWGNDFNPKPAFYSIMQALYSAVGH